MLNDDLKDSGEIYFAVSCAPSGACQLDYEIGPGRRKFIIRQCHEDNHLNKKTVDSALILDNCPRDNKYPEEPMPEEGFGGVLGELHDNGEIP